MPPVPLRPPPHTLPTQAAETGVPVADLAVYCVDSVKFTPVPPSAHSPLTCIPFHPSSCFLHPASCWYLRLNPERCLGSFVQRAIGLCSCRQADSVEPAGQWRCCSRLWRPQKSPRRFGHLHLQLCLVHFLLYVLCTWEAKSAAAVGVFLLRLQYDDKNQSGHDFRDSSRAAEALLAGRFQS